MSEAVLVSAVRTPVGRAPKGALATTRPDDIAATALSGALDRLPLLDKKCIHRDAGIVTQRHDRSVYPFCTKGGWTTAHLAA